MKMRHISVDFDIHKLIETERKGFDETDNKVLRRLFGLPEGPMPTSLEDTAKKYNGDRGLQSSVASYSSKDWQSKGVVLPEGTELRLVHPGAHASGSVQNGTWVIGGYFFNSPSDAAGTLVGKERGRTMNLNGWLYWEVRRPDDSDWVLLNSLRDPEKIERRYR